jgi:GTP-binding protein HflX
VELAHLTWQKSRLVRSWTHLERQRGGFGFLGGPGEAQIETDRRLIEERIDGIKKDLEGRGEDPVAAPRGDASAVPYPVVAIVGYTNAGKSTLFNRLTGASVVARDQVFETLDPTMREMKLASGRRIILSDTVGFISDLPTTLVCGLSAPRWRRWWRPISSCTCATSAMPRPSRSGATSRRCWRVSASRPPRRMRRSWKSGTRPTA